MEVSGLFLAGMGFAILLGSMVRIARGPAHAGTAKVLALVGIVLFIVGMIMGVDIETYAKLLGFH